MTQIRIIIDDAQVASINRQIAAIKNNARVALKRSVNRTVTAVKTVVAKEISGATTLKSSYIKDCISSNLEIESSFGIKGQITLLSGKYGAANKRSYWTPLYRYQNRKNKKGISVKVYKNGPNLKLSRDNDVSIRTFRSGHTGIFIVDKDETGKVMRTRTGKPRLKEMVGPALTQIYLKQPGLSRKVESTASTRLVTELQRQLNYLLLQQSLAP